MTIDALLAEGVISEKNHKSLLERGIYSVPFESKKNGLEMIYQTLDLLIEKNISAKRVKYIILSYYHYSIPYSIDVINSIKNKYGFKNAIGFSVLDLACSNFLMALNVAGKSLESYGEDGDLSIIVSVEKTTIPAQRYGGDLFVDGDAGVAIILGKNSYKDEILSVENVMNVKTVTLGKDKKDFNVVLDYSYLISLYSTFNKALKNSGLLLNQIKRIIPNNTLGETWDNLAKLMKVSNDFIFTEGFHQYGHIGNCDIILNYELLEKDKAFIRGGYYGMLSLGTGGGVGAVIFKKG